MKPAACRSRVEVGPKADTEVRLKPDTTGCDAVVSGFSRTGVVSGLSRTNVGRGARLAAYILCVVAIGLPRQTAAQNAPSEHVRREVVQLHGALASTHGDEGPEIERRLDELTRALADWDRSIRETELTLRPKLQGATADQAADIHASLGSLYMDRRRFEEALVELDAAARLAPGRSTLQMLRAVALDALGRTEEAGRAFQEAWALDRADPAKAYLARTRSPLSGAALDQSRDTLLNASRAGTPPTATGQPGPFARLGLRTDASTAAPVFPLAREAAGFTLIVSGRHEDGVARLREAVASDPLLADPASRSGRIGQALTLLRGRNLAGARAALEAAIRISPRSSEPHRVLATVLELAGERQSSVEHLETAVRLAPDDERSWLALGRARIDSGAPAEAAKTLEAAVGAVPDSGELRWTLAGVLERQQRNDEALEQFDAATRLTALSGRTAVLRQVMAHAGAPHELPRALAAAERRVRLNPDEAAAHRELAALYTRQGRQDEALTELTIAVWLDPEDPFALVALGHAHLAERRDLDAVDALQRAVALHPTLPEARYALGQALTRADRRDEARRQLGEFERLRTEGMARDRRADELLDLKQTAANQTVTRLYPRAVETWRKVIDLEPNVARNYIDLADVLRDAGQLDQALSALVKAADLDGVAEVHQRLAVVLARLGRTKESALARQTYERLRLEDFERRTRR